ncbi:MAG: cytochrome c oxidase subunit I [Chloroflexi bacterium]|nr:cytochrome c oxidase subunit I [Chloroflexota bacterium]
MAATSIPKRMSFPQAMREARAAGATYQGIWSWLTTVDHKRIGVMYGAAAFFFFVVGGIEALLIRIQLTAPEQSFLNPDQYNRIFTMHGTTMVFLVVMPMGAAFFNLLVPLMIGARDVAFPRMNAFSFWVFLGGGILLNTSFFTGGNIFAGELGAPDGGWFGYAPLTLKAYSGGHGIDYWVIGLQILGIASLAGAFNFIVTILNMRAPGMTLFRMPVFVWMTLVTSFLLIFAIPVISVALFQLTFDRAFGANFFNVSAGGTPLLWQHMFWLFGHPEVYILILPAMGIVSEILPVFSKKPLFGYPFVVFSGVAIGFMSWGVWAHHMYTTGLGSVANSAFGISTILIAVPTGIKIFNWMATMFAGTLNLKTPFYFSVGFIAMFTIGGLTGVTHSIVPSDYQQQDTYYIVAHFHQVLFGGAIFALFGGAYYWFPKFTGKLMNETLGMINFWLIFIGFNLTFQPMMVAGLMGMPRRIHTYPSDYGWEFWNAMATVGAFTIALGVLVFMVNFVLSLRKGEASGDDPWDARTLEWTIPSPPPAYNFAEIPHVHSLDDFWHKKYTEDSEGRPVPLPAGASDTAHANGHGDGHGIHLPSPSIMPMIAALGFPIIGLGLVYVNDTHQVWSWLGGGSLYLLMRPLIAVGAAIMVVGLYGWAFEPATEE